MLVLCRRPLAPNCAAHAPRPVPAVPSPQIIDLKKIESAAGGAGTRWRIIISDGQHHQQAMLATQLNANVDSKEVQLNSVVKLTNFITNMVQERKIIIVLGIEVLNTADGRIGAPISVDKAGDQAAAAAPVQQQAVRGIIGLALAALDAGEPVYPSSGESLEVQKSGLGLLCSLFDSDEGTVLRSIGAWQRCRRSAVQSAQRWQRWRLARSRGQRWRRKG